MFSRLSFMSQLERYSGGRTASKILMTTRFKVGMHLCNILRLGLIRRDRALVRYATAALESSFFLMLELVYYGKLSLLEEEGGTPAEVFSKYFSDINIVQPFPYSTSILVHTQLSNISAGYGAKDLLNMVRAYAFSSRSKGIGSLPGSLTFMRLIVAFMSATIEAPGAPTEEDLEKIFETAKKKSVKRKKKAPKPKKKMPVATPVIEGLDLERTETSDEDEEQMQSMLIVKSMLSKSDTLTSETNAIGKKKSKSIFSRIPKVTRMTKRDLAAMCALEEHDPTTMEQLVDVLRSLDNLYSHEPRNSTSILTIDRSFSFEHRTTASIVESIYSQCKAQNAFLGMGRQTSFNFHLSLSSEQAKADAIIYNNKLNEALANNQVAKDITVPFGICEKRFYLPIAQCTRYFLRSSIYGCCYYASALSLPYSIMIENYMMTKLSKARFVRCLHTLSVPMEWIYGPDDPYVKFRRDKRELQYYLSAYNYNIPSFSGLTEKQRHILRYKNTYKSIYNEKYELLPPEPPFITLSRPRMVELLGFPKSTAKVLIDLMKKKLFKAMRCDDEVDKIRKNVLNTNTFPRLLREEARGGDTEASRILLRQRPRDMNALVNLMKTDWPLTPEVPEGEYIGSTYRWMGVYLRNRAAESSRIDSIGVLLKHMLYCLYDQQEYVMRSNAQEYDPVKHTRPVASLFLLHIVDKQIESSAKLIVLDEDNKQLVSSRSVTRITLDELVARTPSAPLTSPFVRVCDEDLPSYFVASEDKVKEILQHFVLNRDDIVDEMKRTFVHQRTSISFLFKRHKNIKLATLLLVYNTLRGNIQRHVKRGRGSRVYAYNEPLAVFGMYNIRLGITEETFLAYAEHINSFLSLALIFDPEYLAPLIVLSLILDINMDMTLLWLLYSRDRPELHALVLLFQSVGIFLPEVQTKLSSELASLIK